jgi:hypothetical protein
MLQNNFHHIEWDQPSDVTSLASLVMYSISLEQSEECRTLLVMSEEDTTNGIS